MSGGRRFASLSSFIVSQGCDLSFVFVRSVLCVPFVPATRTFLSLLWPVQFPIDPISSTNQILRSPQVSLPPWSRFCRNIREVFCLIRDEEQPITLLVGYIDWENKSFLGFSVSGANREAGVCVCNWMHGFMYTHIYIYIYIYIYI